jgi:hypothetical protein
MPSKRPTSAAELSKLFELTRRVMRASVADGAFNSRPSQPPPPKGGFREHTTRQLRTPLPQVPDWMPAE